MALVLAAIASAAGSAVGSDCRLSAGSNRDAVASGEEAMISVFAHFPASAYALAEVELDMHAPMPAWHSVTSGVIGGASVLGGAWDQDHLPHAGSLADPANPMRVWTGRFTPAAPGPKFIKIDAVPSAMSIYPSDLTSSSVPCAADPGRVYLWIDPLPVEGIGAVAPGDGTAVDIGPDGLVVATPDEDEVLVALLLPAVQAAREAARRTRIGWPNQPESLKIWVLPEPPADSNSVPMENFSLNFAKIPDAAPGGERPYVMAVDPGSASGVTVCVWGITPGVPWCVPDDATIEIGRAPTRVESRIVRGPNGDELLIELHADEPRTVRVPGVFDGLTDEPIVVRAWFPRLEGLKGDVVEATAVAGPVDLVYSAACRADLSDDGLLNFFDVQIFVNAFVVGRQDADFDDDGRLSFFDMQAFLAAYAAGCD